MTEEAVADEGAQPFAAFLQDLRGGRAHAELTESLRTLLRLVEERQKPGKLTFTIGVKPEAGAQVTITDEVSVKEPKQTRQVSLFFLTDEHGLSRDDPRQQRLPLREVPPQAKTVKEAK